MINNLTIMLTHTPPIHRDEISVDQIIHNLTNELSKKIIHN